MIEHLQFIISRFDNYIESTQAKTNVYFGINVAIIIFLLSYLTNGHKSIEWYEYIILLTSCLTSLAGIVILLFSLNPQIEKFDAKNSDLFFLDVAEKSVKEYHKKILTKTKKQKIRDLSEQAWCLSKILKKKYEFLSYASKLLFIQVFLFGTWIIFFTFKIITNGQVQPIF